MSIPNGKCVCLQCDIEKDNSEFPYMKNRITKNGFYTRNNKTCKKCINSNGNVVRKLKKNNLRPKLGTPCENCKKPITKLNEFQLDHDHEQGYFRGWLCRKCNVGIGNLGDTIEGLERALKYLKQSKENKILNQIKENTLRQHKEYMDLVKENALNRYIKYGLKSVFLDKEDYKNLVITLDDE